MPDSGSQADYARHRSGKGLPGSSRMSVSNAVKNGRIKESVSVVDGKQVIDFALADQEWERNTDSQKRVNAAGGVERRQPFEGGGPGDHAPVEEVGTATERLKNAQADLAELKYAEAAGDLVDRDLTLREWADVLSRVRTKMLGIPTAFKQAVPHLTVDDVVLLEKAIREALEDAVAAETAL